MVLIALFGRETLVDIPRMHRLVPHILRRMYDRTLKPIPLYPPPSLRYRVNTVIGITGIRMAKYRMNLWDAFLEFLRLVWRPHLLGMLIFEAALFGFSIGINACSFRQLFLH